jgi:hypothetical protein
MKGNSIRTTELIFSDFRSDGKVRRPWAEDAEVTNPISRCPAGEANRCS